MSKRHKGSFLLEDDDDDDDLLVLADPYNGLSSSKTFQNPVSKLSWKKSQTGKSKESSFSASGSKKRTAWISSSFGGFDGGASSQDKPKRTKQVNIEQSFNTGNGQTIQPSVRKDAEDLWLDKHSPKSEAELAVHKKKLAEVRSWLLEHLCKKPSSAILLLTGPSGAGKTATIHVLANELDFEVQEWINPVSDTQDYESSNWTNTTQSQLRKFQDFLLRANKYPTLSIFSGNTAVKKIILVEDLPNIFFRDTAKLHEVLSAYQQSGRSPVVFIISDSHHGDSNVHRLLPKDIQQKLRIHNISFNPVAHTSLVKAINRITSLESQQGKSSFLMPSKDTVELLAQNSGGDIRTAINGLQFSCLKDKSCILTKKSNQKKADKQHKKSKTTSTLDKQNRKMPSNSSQSGQMSKFTLYGKGTDSGVDNETVTAIGGKDTALFLFRALGKILYCKRDSSSSDAELLPTHLSHCARNQLLFNPEEVLERTHLSSDMFNLYLHQNYLEFFSNIDDVTSASEYLSDADYLTKEWMYKSSMKEYSSCLAARALIFNNVTRSTSSTGGVGRGWRPLHKPQWWDVSRRMRDGCSTARDLFRGYFWPSLVLQTEILPYLAITDVPLRTPGQISFLEVIGNFRKIKSPFRSLPETLDEKDCGTGSDDEIGLSSSQQKGTGAGSQGLKRPRLVVEQSDSQDTPGEPQDIDDIIEDFDDD